MTTQTRCTKTATAFGFKNLEADGEPTGTFEAIVAVFNNVDHAGDRIIPGAFAKSLDRWKASGDPIPVIFSHQWEDLDAHIGIAAATDIKELAPGDTGLPAELADLGGLYVKGRLDVDEDFAARVWKRMERRSIKEFSFAYEVGQATPTKDALNLVELDLIEVGPTLKGMNPATALLDVKAAGALVKDLTPAEAIELIDSLVDPETKSATPETKALRATASVEGSIEELQRSVKASAKVWALLKYGGDLFDCHLEATFPAESRAIVVAERWTDPWGEGPVHELAYTLDDDGNATITDAADVEVTIEIRRAGSAAAKARLDVPAVLATMKAEARGSVPPEPTAKVAKTEEPEVDASHTAIDSPAGALIGLADLELQGA